MTVGLRSTAGRVKHELGRYLPDTDNCTFWWNAKNAGKIGYV